MSRRLLALAAVLAATAALCVPAASASRYIEHGIFDDAQIHYGNPDIVFPMLKQLRSQLLRINLQWGGPNAVARRRPARPTDPEDPAYNWAEYDRTVNYAQQYGHKVVFAIIGTPPWANKNKGLNVAPTNPLDLQRFAAAAATRYSGTYEAPDGRILPPVRRWLAWNEPNNPAFLRPQYKKVNGKQTIQSAKRLREDLQRDRQGHPGHARRRGEGRLRRHRARAGTTTRTRAGRPSRRSRSCAR